MEEERFRLITIIKEKILNEDFDYYYNKFKNKAIDDGYEGDLKFVRSHGKVEVFVKLINVI